MVRVSDLARAPFWDLLGIEPVAGDDGAITLRVEVDEKLLQFYGKVHGGVMASLVDAASAVAVNQKLGPDRGATTVEMKINYLHPVERGTLHARGEVVHMGRTLAVANAVVLDGQGTKITYGTATFYLIDMKR